MEHNKKCALAILTLAIEIKLHLIQNFSGGLNTSDFIWKLSKFIPCQYSHLYSTTDCADPHSCAT